MLAYFMAHWRGDQNIAQSLLVNGALPYFAMGTVLLLVYMLTLKPGYLAWVLVQPRGRRCSDTTLVERRRGACDQW